MASRLALQTMLENILGSSNVYYQPPASVSMSYPAIVYSKKNIENRHANDSIYCQTICYEVTIISRIPDNPVVDLLSHFPLCRFDRHYISDNLNHDTFTIYY